IYFARLIDELGIAAEIKPKAKLTGPATAAAELVANGGAALVIDQVVQLRQVQGLDLITLPGDLKARIAMSAGIVTNAREPEAGSALVKFFGSPAAAAVIKTKGMEP